MKVSEMSVEELKELIAEVVEQKLEELLGDPDWGMELKEEVKQRLRRSSEIERGVPASKVAKRLGLVWLFCQPKIKAYPYSSHRTSERNL